MRRRSLKVKLILSGTFLVLFPVLVIGFFSVWKSTEALQTEARQGATGNAKAIAEMVELTLAQEVKFITELSTRKNVIDAAVKASAGAAEGTPEIESVRIDLESATQKIGKDYEVILLTDVKGNCIVDGIGGKTKGISTADRDYFLSAKAGKPFIGNPVKSKMTGRPIAPVSAPIYTKTGEFVGAAVAIMNIDFVGERAASFKKGKTGYSFMMDSRGICIAHPKKEAILTLDVNKLEGMQELAVKMLSLQAGADPYSIKGVKKIAGYAPVKLTGWSVGVTQDIDEFLAPAHMIRNFILIVGIVFLGATLVAVPLLSRRISAPIMQAANELNEGALQVTAAAGQVSAASQTLAEGSSEAASSIEETSSSLEELSAMTKTNAGHAVESKQMMAEARTVVEKVDRNMTQMAQAIQEVTNTSEQTGKIIKTIDEIAAASEEQSRGIEQINRAVAEMDKVTQSNAATAEESAGASEELNAQSEQIKSISARLYGVVGGNGQAARTGGSEGLWSRLRKRSPSDLLPVLRSTGTKSPGSKPEGPDTADW